jgi:hypothetical protein
MIAVIAACCLALCVLAGPALAQEPPLPVTPSAEPTASPPSCSAVGATGERAAHACVKRRPPQAERVPDVASLKTPESPAFMALGIAPSEIQRPTTPTGLKVSLANGFASGGSLPLLQNFALEFSPFWLLPHRKLSYEQVVAQPWAALWRNFSVSLATGPQDLEKKTSETDTRTVRYGRFATGARLTLWPGRATEAAKQCAQYIRGRLQASVNERSDAELDFVSRWDAEHPRPNVVPVAIRPPTHEQYPDDGDFDAAEERYLDARENAVAIARAASPAYLRWAGDREAAQNEFHASYVGEHRYDDPEFQRCLRDIHAREGFMAEAATAYAASVPNGDVKRFDSTALRAVTLWVTAGYVFENLFKRSVEASVLGVFRYQSGRGAIEDRHQQTTSYDYGGRLAVAWECTGVSIEATRRWREVQARMTPESNQKLYRMALSIDYRLSGGIWFTGTFGKDFGSPESAPLLALANLQWNFDVERGVKPDSKVTQ